MELLTERYLHSPLKSSYSTTGLPDIFNRPLSRSLSKINISGTNNYVGLPYTHRGHRNSTPWRPSTYFATPIVSSSSNTYRSTNNLGKLVNNCENSKKFYEIEGLRAPSVYSAARNALYTRYTPFDWNKTYNSYLIDSENARKQAEILRYTGSRLANEANDQVRQTQQEVNKLLGQRISDVNFVKNELQNEIDYLVDELTKLVESKRVAEKAFAETENPLHIAQECLYHREKRQSTDLVHDDPERSLLQEVDTIKSYQDKMSNVIKEATAQIKLCRAVQHELEKDISDKFQALQLDQVSHQLRNTSANLGMHCGIESIQKWMSVPEKWLEHSTENVKRSQSVRATSRSIRELIENVICTSFSHMREQWALTNSAISKRFQETMEAKNQLHMQLEKVKQELFDIEANMEYLKRCISDKQDPLKVARTRLDLRLRRPNVELCRDDPHNKLVHEVAELQEAINQLTNQLIQLQSANQQLLKMKSKLEIELSIKSNSLFIDREKCLGLRKSFPMNPSLIAPA